MKIKMILSIGCMSVFAVSCAHKAIEKEPVKPNHVHTVKPESKSVTESKPEVESKTSDVSFNCTLGQDSRTITLQKGDKRCEVHYTKAGNLNNIAWGEQTPSICDKVFDNVRSNIEKGGFKCNDHGQKTASNAN